MLYMSDKDHLHQSNLHMGCHETHAEYAALAAEKGGAA